MPNKVTIKPRMFDILGSPLQIDVLLMNEDGFDPVWVKLSDYEDLIEFHKLLIASQQSTDSLGKPHEANGQSPDGSGNGLIDIPLQQYNGQPPPAQHNGQTPNGSVKAAAPSLTREAYEALKRENEHLKQNVAALQKSLKTFQENYKNAQQKNEEFRKKFPSSPSPEELLYVSLITQLNVGKRDFYDKTNDLRTAACVSFLIEHALVQLLSAPRQHAPVYKRAMLLNLRMIAEKLARYKGTSVVGFDATGDVVQQLLDTLPDGDPERVPKKKTHVDNKFFQAIHKHVLDRTRINLAPYYYAMDDKGKFYRIG